MVGDRTGKGPEEDNRDYRDGAVMLIYSEMER